MGRHVSRLEMAQIPFQLPSGLAEFSKLHHLPSAALFQLAYAVVLYRFFDTTQFVYQDATAGYAYGMQAELDVDQCVARIAKPSQNGQVDLITYLVDRADATSVLAALGRCARPGSLDSAESQGKAILRHVVHASEEQKRQAGRFALVVQPPQHRDTSEYSLGDATLHMKETLTIVLRPSPSHVDAFLQYDPLAHSEFLVQGALRAFSAALDYMLHSPQDSVAKIELCSDYDKSLINSWNQTELKTEESLLHKLFEAAAVQHAGKVALQSWEGEMTYHELNSMANRLARHLAAQYSLQPGFRAALCFDKSNHAVITMLAVLKAGGAYCCLDPAHPKARHDFILNAVHASLVLTNPGRSSLFGSESKVPVAILDTNLFDHLDYTDQNLDSESTPDQVCLISFTSGSTGVPKGIMHTHTSMCSGLLDNAPRQRLARPGTRVFQWAAYTFDVSLAEIYAPLLHGGRICTPTEEERLNDVEGAMNRMECEWAFFTPSFSRFFQRYSIPSLKTLSLGGEAVTPEDVNAWADRVAVLQAYGPAEGITWFVKELGYSDPVSRSTSVGRPENTHGWLVDPNDHNRLVPIGAIGELLMEGPAMFRGYVNEPERTDSVLVDAPAWRDTVGVPCTHKLYKVGDLMRYLPDGEMVYVGRKDAMVKLRGQRIDLGEIETVVRTSLGDVVEVAADLIIPSGRNGDQALVAFLKLKDENANPAMVQGLVPFLQGQLRKNLPEYMVPRIFHQIDALPYNASGKLDRKVLRQWASTLTVEQLMQTQISISNNSEEVSKGRIMTKIEAEFQRLWAAVLKVDSDTIGPDANFFSLGGSSITSIELIAAAREAGYAINYADVFSASSLAALAASAVRTETIQTVADPEPYELLPANDKDRIIRDALAQCRVRSSEIEEIYPLTPQQEGLWALSLASDQSHVGHFSIRLRHDVDEVKFRAAWDAVARAYAFMRTRIIHSASGVYAVVLNKVARWRVASSVEEYISKDVRTPVEAGQPLTRYAFVKERGPSRLSPSQDIVVWTSHHAVYDGVSVLLFLNALGKAYHGELPTPEVPFSRFLQYTRTSNPTVSQDYWLEQLDIGGVTAFPKLPYPSYRPRSLGLLAHSLRFVQPAHSTVTNANLLRAALALTLSQMSGSAHITHLETVSGRTVPVPGVQHILAPTFATIPRPTRVDPASTIDIFLQQVQQSSIDVSPHVHFGIPAIRRLSPSCAAACEFQTIMVIEPAYEREYNDVFTFDETGGGMERFNSDLLMFKCDLTEGGARLIVSFDENVVSTAHAETAAELFAHNIGFLCEEDRSRCLLECKPAQVAGSPPSVLDSGHGTDVYAQKGMSGGGYHEVVVEVAQVV